MSMKETEQKALFLRRKALEVLDGKLDRQDLLRELHQLERNDPPFFDSVVKQLEDDNNRWSESSGLPHVSVERDEQERVKTVTFIHLDRKDAKELTFRSDLMEREWAEAFARQLIDECDKSKDKKQG